MQVFSNGDNLHEMSNTVFWEKLKKKKIKITSLLSAELAKRVVKVKSS